MKKSLFAFLIIVGSCLVTHAQEDTSMLRMMHDQQLPSSSTSVTTSNTNDISRMTSGIVNQISAPLKLNDQQRTDVTGVINQYLTDRTKVVPLSSTATNAERIDYDNKYNNLRSSLKSNLSKVLTNGQLKKFKSMKPSTNDPTNVLSTLFY